MHPVYKSSGLMEHTLFPIKLSSRRVPVVDSFYVVFYCESDSKQREWSA